MPGRPFHLRYFQEYNHFHTSSSICQSVSFPPYGSGRMQHGMTVAQRLKCCVFVGGFFSPFFPPLPAQAVTERKKVWFPLPPNYVGRGSRESSLASSQGRAVEAAVKSRIIPSKRAGDGLGRWRGCCPQWGTGRRWGDAPRQPRGLPASRRAPLNRCSSVVVG